MKACLVIYHLSAIVAYGLIAIGCYFREVNDVLFYYTPMVGMALMILSGVILGWKTKNWIYLTISIVLPIVLSTCGRA